MDLGYRGVDADNPGVRVMHRGRIKSMSKLERKRLKRRQAVEPVIGHVKHDHRMIRCHLIGSLGDALHAIACAAGYNIRWLMRAMLRLGPKGHFAPLNLWLWAVLTMRCSCVREFTRQMSQSQLRLRVSVWFPMPKQSQFEFCRDDYKTDAAEAELVSVAAPVVFNAYA